jgi:thioredoxin-like negative regulator of GroEL
MLKLSKRCDGVCCDSDMVRLADAFEVVSVDPSHYDAQLRLANVLEDMGQKAEALEIVMNGMSA